MARSMSIVAARRQLGKLAEEVRRTGKVVVLTRRGKPVAQLAPEPSSATSATDPLGALRGTVETSLATAELHKAVRVLRDEFAASLGSRSQPKSSEPRRKRRD